MGGYQTGSPKLTTTRISVIDDDESCPFGDDAEIIECIKTQDCQTMDIVSTTALSTRSMPRELFPIPTGKTQQHKRKAPPDVCEVPPRVVPHVTHDAYPSWHIPIGFPMAQFCYPMLSTAQFCQPAIHTLPMNGKSANQKCRKLECEYCCSAFVQWSLNPRRNGRPPHLRNCPNRAINRKQI